MTFKCIICGRIFKTPRICVRCENTVCWFCFWKEKELCANCIVMEYNEEYIGIIKDYEKKICTII